MPNWSAQRRCSHILNCKLFQVYVTIRITTDKSALSLAGDDLELKLLIFERFLLTKADVSLNFVRALADEELTIKLKSANVKHITKE
jgi:hypothetical protein